MFAGYGREGKFFLPTTVLKVEEGGATAFNYSIFFLTKGATIRKEIQSILLSLEINEKKGKLLDCDKCDSSTENLEGRLLSAFLEVYPNTG